MKAPRLYKFISQCFPNNSLARLQPVSHLVVRKVHPSSAHSKTLRRHCSGNGAHCDVTQGTDAFRLKRTCPCLLSKLLKVKQNIAFSRKLRCGILAEGYKQRAKHVVFRLN